MNMTTISEEVKVTEAINPGAQLGIARQQKGFTQEYVASKLHLRVRVIQLLESDDYDRLPESVFIKGYLRAYAKLMGINHEPLLEKYNSIHTPDVKQEKALWQTRRESNKAEHAVRWVTALFAVGVLVAVSLWWQQNKEAEKVSLTKESSKDVALSAVNPEVRLTDLSKMQSLFSSSNISPVEKKGE